jgi:hypothetical protein
MAEHSSDASHDAGDAYNNMKTHHGEEDRVNGGHRNAEHDGCVTGHGISASGDLRSWAHRRGEQTCYRENAFEALRDCCSVDLIEDVPALLLGRDDRSCGQLVQVSRDNRAVLRQTGGDGGDIATAQQDKLAQYRAGPPT